MKGYDNNWNDQAKTWAQQTIANEQHESRMLKEFELEQQYGDEFRAWKKERNHKKLIGCLVALIIVGVMVSAGLWFFDPLGGSQNNAYEPAQEKVEKANQDIQKELQESTPETQQEEYEDAETLEDVEQYTEEANATTEIATETTETPETEENHQMGDGYVPAHFEQNQAVLQQWENLGGDISGRVELNVHDCIMKGHHLVITDTTDTSRLALGRPVPEAYPILFCDDCAQAGQREPVIAALDN